jgi:hypothetical protein
VTSRFMRGLAACNETSWRHECRVPLVMGLAS